MLGMPCAPPVTGLSGSERTANAPDDLAESPAGDDQPDGRRARRNAGMPGMMPAGVAAATEMGAACQSSSPAPGIAGREWAGAVV